LQREDGACVFDDAAGYNKKSPGFSFQASLCWLDLNQNNYSDAAENWTRNSGLWQLELDDNGIKGGWIDWIEGVTQADWWLRFIDTSFYSIAAFGGGYDFSTTQAFSPPTATLDVQPTSVVAGQPFTVTVTGTSPVRLASVWWFVEDVDYPEFHWIDGSVDGVPVNLAAAQDFGAGFNLLTHTYSRTVIIDEPGNYVIKSNARDRLYPIAGEPHQASEGEGMSVIPLTIEFSTQ